MNEQNHTNKLFGYFPNEFVKKDSIKPIMSCLIVISTMMLIVFAKMEVRRLGYAVFKLTKTENQMTDAYRKKQIFLAGLNRPERIEHLARKKLHLKKARKDQIIQLVAEQTALRYSTDH